MNGDGRGQRGRRVLREYAVQHAHRPLGHQHQRALARLDDLRRWAVEDLPEGDHVPDPHTFVVEGFYGTLKGAAGGEVQVKVPVLPAETSQATAPLVAAPPSGREAASASRRRGPGRPPWDPKVFRRRLVEAEEATPEPRTLERIAERFVRLDGSPGIDPSQLRRLLRDHGDK